MSRTIHIHLSEPQAQRIEKFAEGKGLPTSTAIRVIVCEYISALAEPPAKPPASAASTQPVKEVEPA